MIKAWVSWMGSKTSEMPQTVTLIVMSDKNDQNAKGEIILESFSRSRMRSLRKMLT